MEFWIFILSLWAFYVWVQSRIRRKKEDERFANVVNALNRLEPRLNDLKKLETRVAELEHRLAASAPPAHEAAHPPVAAAPLQPPAPKPIEPSPPVPLPPAPGIPKPSAPTPPPAHPAEPPAPHPPTPAPPTPLHKPAPPPTPPVTPHPPTTPRPTPPPLSPPPKPAPISAREATSQFEELLGKNWLSKIGIIAIVIGIAYFLGAEFHKLGNPAKIALCYLVSFLILGTGIYLERLDRYRVFARALIGGGWALVFFVTFAMHFVPYTRVIDTQWVDLVLLFIVAAAMVVHTLRYDSQVVTGLAFLLAFTTVAISQNTIYSLSAGAILALGLVVIVHRRQWFELEVFGILASYGNHFLWLANVIVPANGHHRLFPEFVPSTVLLCLYWAIYRWSYIARQIKTPAQETVSTLAAIVNTSLLLALFKYQAIRPELAFYALLFLGCVELALGQLPVTRQRRVAFTILSSIGIVLLVAAIPFKYSGMDTAIIWLAEAQMLLLAGVFSREILFRVFGMLVAVLTSGDMLLNQALPRLYDGLALPVSASFTHLPRSLNVPDTQLAVSFFVAGLLFYANAVVIPYRWKDLVTAQGEETALRAFSYLAGFMLFISLWLAFPPAWTAVGWMAAAFLLVVLSQSLDLDDLNNQAHLFALAAFFRSLDVNAFLALRFLHTTLTLRLVTLTLVIVLLYLCARWLVADEAPSALASSELYTTAAAILFVILSYRECDPVWIGSAWGAFALVLAISGYFRDRRDLSLQAHFLVLAGFARTLLFNLDATQEWHGFTYRFLTFTLMTALLYFCAYFSGPRDSAYAGLFSALETWCGSILIAVLAFAEVASPWIALTWALLAVALFEFGVWRKSRNFRAQSYVLFFLSFVRLILFNLDLPRNQLLFYTLPIAFIFYCVYLRHWHIGESREQIIGDQEAWVGSMLGFLGSITLILFCGSYLPSPGRFVAWAALSLIFLAIAYLTPLELFLWHSALLAFFVSFRTLAYEFQLFPRSDAYGEYTAVYYVSAVAAILFAGLAFAFPLRVRFAARANASPTDGLRISASEFLRRPEQIYFFLPFGLITLLILNEVSFGRVTIACGIEAVVAFLFALIVRERSFRLAGLVLLLLCVAKIGLLDVWRLHGSDRYVTLIILGVALLLVSYLYTRYSDTIRRYL